MMAIYRTDWITDIGTIQREMERLMDHYAGAKPPMIHFAKRAWEPAVDVYETSEHIVIVVDLAGIEEESLKIIGDRTTFVIQGERANPGAGTNRSYHQMEIISGPFERVIRLPLAVEVEQARAQYRCGMLEITVPKSKSRISTKSYIRIVHGGRTSDGI
ncbi:MAG: Hsp20/alpha crystallin family protein [Dehalococcoidia bacterium]|nr:Hsp20/alpha crystallin family protein [Dehalococcoidia bacterium]